MPETIGEERLLNGYQGRKEVFGYILQSVKPTHEERKRRRRIWYTIAGVLLFLFVGLFVAANWVSSP